MAAFPGTSFVERLAQVVGEAHVLTEPADTAPFFTDWRRQYSASAECVVRPASTAQVAEVVRLCAAEGVALVPQGGNTGLSGGSVPTGARREIVVSLARMNRVRELDALNDTITVEAGCVLAAIQDAAARAGRLFPLSLAAESSCQIGGNLATNAGGVNVLRYGNAREQVLGLELVLADGRVWNGLRALRKDNTGYDLKQLFVGAEGTLGIITAAVLKLYPRPSAALTAWIGLDSPSRAVALLAHLRGALGERISAFELVSRVCLEAVLGTSRAARDPLPAPHPWYVLAQLDDLGAPQALRAAAETVLEQAAERGLVADVVIAHSETQANALWRLRETLPEAQFRNVKHDVSVPVSHVAELIERADAALAAAFPGAVTYTFGHVGDGNLHYNVGMPDAAATEALMAQRDAVNEIVFQAVAALGGSISAEHGLGQLKREAIRRYKDPLELELMRAVKHALDPAGLMNPGKVI